MFTNPCAEQRIAIEAQAGESFGYTIGLHATDAAGNTAEAAYSIRRVHPPLKPVALYRNDFVHRDAVEMRAPTPTGVWNIADTVYGSVSNRTIRTDTTPSPEPAAWFRVRVAP